MRRILFFFIHRYFLFRNLKRNGAGNIRTEVFYARLFKAHKYNVVRMRIPIAFAAWYHGKTRRRLREELLAC